jgi:sugar lactone lactonase YvrE
MGCHRWGKAAVSELAALLILCCSPTNAQRIIKTVVGTDWIFQGDGRPALDAALGNVHLGLATDLDGNVLIADQSNHIVWRILSNLQRVAGNGVQGYSGDGGSATDASLSNPEGVAIDPQGNIYIADLSNHRIRKVSTDGRMSTVAGNGRSGFSGEGGPAVQAALSGPNSVAVDGVGNLLIADTGNHRIRKVSPNGIITTVAGNGQSGYSGDGERALQAALMSPTGVAFDAIGNIFIADRFNHRIRKVSPDGIITTVAGDGRGAFSGDGRAATAASLRLPKAVIADSIGNLYIADTANSRIRKVRPDGTILTFAGGGAAEDGTGATSASVPLPDSVASDHLGNIYISQRGGVVRRLDDQGFITRIAGNGSFRSVIEGAAATNAYLFFPRGVTLDREANLYIADSSNAAVRRVAAAGHISTLAGTGLPACSSDNQSSTLSNVGKPDAVTVDNTGSLYFVDSTCNSVRQIKQDGTLATVVGTPYLDGPVTGTTLNGPSDITFDSTGNLFIAERQGHRILKVSTNGVVSVVAGSGRAGFSGDNGPAVAAQLNMRSGIASGPAGDLFIADTNNQRIRRLTPGGMILTVAGNGSRGFSGDRGPAIRASLNSPQRVS